MTIREVPLPADTIAPALELATGQDACERLLSIDGLPEEVDLETRRRMVDVAPELRDLLPAATVRRLRIPMPGGWSLLEPSIARGPHGFRMIVQSSNWFAGPGQIRHIHDANGATRSRHMLADVTADFDVQRVQAITERVIGRQPQMQPAAGFGAARLMLHHGESWMVATARDTEKTTPGCPLLARLDGSRVVKTVAPSHDTAHGAWMPILDEGGESLDLAFLASVFPTETQRYDPATKSAVSVARQSAPLIARKLEAESAVVPCDDGYLCLAREAVSFAGGEERAVHRWVWFDRDWRLTRLTRPFVFQRRGAEWAPGLARDGDMLLVSFGVESREAWVASVPVSSVTRILLPPLELDLVAAERQLENLPEIVPLPAPSIIPIARSTAPAARPAIVSMTMTGNSRDDIADALRSVVDWVDWCLLVDTGIDDDTIDIARSVAGDKLIVRQFPWCSDFSAARNFSLTAAAEIGADWAVTVDSDERVFTNGVDVRDVLANTAEPALFTVHASGDYSKDRFFRLPAGGEFKGMTHEAFYRTDRFGGATVNITGVVFDELKKSKERFRLKDERDVAMLTRQIQIDPDEPRWRFYLGDALHRLDRRDEAIAAFRACAALRGWEEEGAWALYRAAECLLELGQVEEAFETCVLGLTRHAGLGDLSWFAAYLSLQLGRPEQAVYWARISIPLGYFAGVGKSVERIGWRFPFALWEGPYDILRFALRRLGDETGAEEAERVFLEAAAARERFYAKT